MHFKFQVTLFRIVSFPNSNHISDKSLAQLKFGECGEFHFAKLYSLILSDF